MQVTTLKVIFTPIVKKGFVHLIDREVQVMPKAELV